MPLPLDSELPSLATATDWYNGPVTAEAEGVTLVHFWSVSCGICGEQMPQVNRLRDTWAARGLRMVAVHKPLHEKDTDLTRVEASIQSHELRHPVAVDNTHALSDAFHNDQGVPEFFLFDAHRRLRLNVVGDQGLDSLEKMIALLTRAAQLEAQPRV
ncbi:MAG TPA: TlpA disulfide reductase family protein [Candidatus Xenobia bacterium]|jgi:hypothetical protein